MTHCLLYLASVDSNVSNKMFLLGATDLLPMLRTWVFKNKCRARQRSSLQKF